MVWDQETDRELGLLAFTLLVIGVALTVLARQKMKSPGDLVRHLTAKERKRHRRR